MVIAKDIENNRKGDHIHDNTTDNAGFFSQRLHVARVDQRVF